MDRQREQSEHMPRKMRQIRILLVIASLVLVCGLFAQITVRSQVSDRAKEIAAVQAQIEALSSNVDNLTRCINQHHNLPDIEKRALTMGMVSVQEDQMRRVVLSDVNTSTQTVANTDGEEING